MRVLITGGAGFLGYHLAAYLGRHGHTSIVYDIVAPDPAEYPGDMEYVVGDVRNLSSLRRAIEQRRPDQIIHGAAALPLWLREDIYTVNLDGTKYVLTAARDAGVDRVVFISSTAVYGVPDKHPLEEDDPMIGVGPYGESKILAERVCEEGRREGLCVPVIRPKTFIGTGRLGVFQILCDWVESGVRIPMIGSGGNTYQLLDVEDLCGAIYLAMAGPRDVVNDVFNVGSSDLRPVREYLGALCAHAGTGSTPMATNAAMVKTFLRCAEVLRLSPLYKWVYGTADTDSWVSTQRIERALGWKPEFSNSDALIRCYAWYLAHKHELAGATGITHRVAWRQGVLGLVKRCLGSRRGRRPEAPSVTVRPRDED